MKKIIFLILILIFFFGCTQPAPKEITKKTDSDETGNILDDSGGTAETGNDNTNKELKKDPTAEDVTGDLTDLMDDLEGLENDFT
ncbi:hypothetical protein KKG83_02450 [Candidatus Micrarchaeota archaeon]|nr:hypothetical protein [Candidatus Micrarchaeota archaeon]MBU2476310.1 hypothetical protein [Candidatus Micrarchaeota archaeon]